MRPIAGESPRVAGLQPTVDLHASGDALYPPPGPEQVEGLDQAIEVLELAGRDDIDVDGFQRHPVESSNMASEDDVPDPD